MIPTYIGVIVALLGVVLLTRPAERSLAFFAYCTLFAGSSAIDLNSLGGASMPPANFALVFLVLRLWRQDLGRSEIFLRSLQGNSLLLVFAVYGAATAFVFPRLFAGRIWVIPMGTSSLGASRLEPTAQNITTAVYLLSTAATAVAASMIALSGRASKLMIFTFIAITWIHVATGLIDLILSSAHANGLLDIVRNGHYAQLNQSFGDVHRISGIMPEPSVYAAYGGVCLVLMTEFWLRNLQSRASGIAAVAMLVLLGLATSSTGYVYIAAYGGILWLRFILLPASISSRKFIQFILVQIFGSAAAFVIMVADPHLAAQALGILKNVTLAKSDSASGLQRAEWAKQGLIALRGTYGLGAGVGSFRSSSIITAILGSTGPISLLVFLAYLIKVWQPLRRSSYRPVASVDMRLAASAGWGAVMVVISEAAVAPSPDPGIVFALLSGLAIGLRQRQTEAAQPSGRRAPLIDALSAPIGA